MCDGCGHGHNKFAGCVQKYHVRFSFHRNGHNLSCNEIVKLLLVGTLCVAAYAKDSIVGACHCTNDGQEHKLACWTRTRHDFKFHLRVRVCREQGSHCHARPAISLGIVSWGQGTSCSNSFVSKVLGVN